MADDHRFQCLKQQVAYLNVGQERLLKQMNEFFQEMHAQEEASSSNQREHHPRGVGELSSGTVQAKTVRLEFPKYDGLEDPTIRLCRAEQYFKFQGTIEVEKLRLASYHLERDAQV